MAEFAGSRSILFGKGMAEPITKNTADMFKMPDPRRFESNEITRSLHELAGATVPLRLESFQERKKPDDVWRGVVLGVQSFKSDLLEHNAPYINEDKQLGIAFPQHVEVITPKGLGEKRDTHLHLVGQNITNTMEHAMLVGLAKRHLERGKPVDMKWLQDTFHTTTVDGLAEAMKVDQRVLTKHMTEAWVELAFGKVIQNFQERVQPIREKIIASRNAVTTKLEQMAQRKITKKEKAVAIVGVVFAGVSPFLGGCSPTTVTPEMPTLPPATDVPTKPTEIGIPTEYVLPGVSTETSTVPTQAALETPPAQIEGVMVLPGIEPSAGGPDLIKNPYSTGLRDVINAAKFGLVSGENVSVKTGQTCISNVPEKLWHDTLPKNEQLLKETVNGVATYVDQQVLAEVPIPADTKDATYSCALGYTKNNGDYIDGTLFQLLIKTNTADGSQEVVATMKAGFSTTDNVEVKNGAVLVNGETQGWTAQTGMELPAETIEFKAGIPATMEECNTLELQYKPDGTIDRDWLSEQMKALSKVEHQWLVDQGITVNDVSLFNLNKQQQIASAETLPYPTIKLSMEKYTVTSCSRVNYNGHEYMIYGIAGRRNENSTEIGILHVLYDALGKRASFEARDRLDYYNTHFTPDLVFENAKNNNLNEISVFLKGYGQTTDQALLDRWEASQAFATINNSTDNNDEQLMIYIDPLTQATLEEEKQWIAEVEQFVFPAQTISPAIQ